VPKKTLLDNIDKDYFEFLFDVILEITNNKEVSQIYIDFKKELQKITNTSLAYEYSSQIQKIHKKNTDTKRVVIISVLIAIMSVIFYFYLVQNKRPIVRSDLVTPHDDILLKRPELYKTIDSKLKSQHGISRIVLVGIGGSGKTTLAYHYAKSHNGSIVWEIDADNSSNILLSFEKLAIVLAYI
jgi:glucose-6-phosphate isomerase